MRRRFYKMLITGILLFLISSSSFCQAVGLKFKNLGKLPEGDYYVMTKDSVKHNYTDIDGFRLIKRKKFVLSETESYPVAEVIAYKAIYKRYGNIKNYVLEYKLLDGSLLPKYVVGRINVFYDLELLMGASNVTRRSYYLQKGDEGIPVELTKENAETLIYDMIKDYEPAKIIMDKNKKSFGNVVDAVNEYNGR